MKNITLIILLFLQLFSFGQQSWKLHNTNIQTKGKFTGIAFTSTNYGFLVGDSSTFLSTMDGGKTWKQDSLPESKRDPENYLNIKFIDGKIGFTATEYALYKTTDSGRNWEKNDFLSYRYSGIGTFDSTFFIYGDLGFGQLFFARYSLAKDSFATSIGFFPIYRLEKLQYIGDSNVIVAKDSGKIYHSSDLGKTLEEVYAPIEDRLSNLRVNDFFFINKDTGFACFNYRLLKKTVDGGKNWFTDTTIRFDKSTTQTHRFSMANGRLHLTGNTFGGKLSIFYLDKNSWLLDTTIGSLNWDGTAGVAGNSMGLFAPTSNSSIAYKTKWDQINTIEEFKETEFLIYPNPSKSIINIQLKEATINGNTSIVIRNYSGQIIKKIRIKFAQTTLVLPNSGIYFISLNKSGRIVKTKKIVIL